MVREAREVRDADKRKEWFCGISSRSGRSEIKALKAVVDKF